VPRDASFGTRKLLEGTYGGGGHNATWATYEELCTIDPDEHALEPSARIHEFEIDAQGREVLVGKAEWSARAAPFYVARRGEGSGIRTGGRRRSGTTG
jgi:hypothetical protein